MSKELLMPELAESVVEGEILKWLVKEGDAVKQDQPLVEVMTDKVTVELPSPFAGQIEKIVAQEGQVVPVHGLLALVADGQATAQTTKTENKIEAIDVTATASAVGSDYGAPKEKRQIDFGQKQPITAQEERSIVEGNTQEEDQGDAQSLFKAFNREEEIKLPTRGADNANLNKFGRVLAVPAARKLARDNNIDIASVPGSGPNGRVRLDDVENYLKSGQKQPQTATKTLAQPVSGGLPVAPVQYKTPKGYENLEERKPIRGLRRAISNQMMASHLYTVRTLTVDEVDMTELVSLRKRLKAKLESENKDTKLTYLPFIFKALVSALKQFPNVNSSLDEANSEIVYKKYYNLGLAVETEAGLIVPVVKDVDRKSIIAIANDISDLANRARESKLNTDDTQGSTFSVTNIGSIGALFSFPIINVPDAAILGVHSIQERAVVRNGEIVVRSMMYLSLSFDHRLVDGAEAARFTKALIRLLENPDILMLEA